MTYQSYFFDFDHTLFDSDASEALAFDHALADHLAPDLFAIYRRINAELWGDVEAGAINPVEVRTLRFERLVETASLQLDPLALADAFTAGMQNFGELYPGAAEVVTQLRERAPVVMVTNAISEIQRGRIERLGIKSLFDAIVISSEVGVSKPSPAIFDHAFAALDDGGLDAASPSTTLMVGDSLTSDMAGGCAAGLSTCWFNPHRKTRTTTLALDHEIVELGQLLSL